MTREMHETRRTILRKLQRNPEFPALAEQWDRAAKARALVRVQMPARRLWSLAGIFKKLARLFRRGDGNNTGPSQDQSRGRVAESDKHSAAAEIS